MTAISIPRLSMFRFLGRAGVRGEGWPPARQPNCAVFSRVIPLMSSPCVPKMGRTRNQARLCVVAPRVRFDTSMNDADTPSWSTTPMNEATEQTDGCPLPLLEAADLQDHLMTATNDLDRLQTLLADACDALAKSFYGATEQLQALMKQQAAGGHADVYPQLMQQLGGAVTALQFQDMASQLINHTNRRLRSCADQIARVAMGDDEDGAVVVEEPPLRPNPVTQDEMDAGSIELF